MSEEKRKSGAAETRASEPGSAAKRPAVSTPEKRPSKPDRAKGPPRAPEPPRTKRAPGSPGPARLFALLAGAFLALLGVLGFFYDAGFGTGSSLASDDLAGTLMVNGWRNVIYLATGIVALAFAPRRARATALGLGLFYLVYAIWGFIVTDRGIGSILDFLPLGNDDNALHLVIGMLGTFAALVDGPLPKVPERLKAKLPKPKPKPRRKPKLKTADRPKSRPKRPVKPEPKGEKAEKAAKPRKPEQKTARSGRGSRAAGREGPRRGDASEPR